MLCQGALWPHWERPLGMVPPWLKLPWGPK